jgi:hypothetical protein
MFRPAAPGSEARLPDFQLIVVQSDDSRVVGKSFPVVGRSFTLGRGAGDLRVDDPAWSRQHATIEILDDGFLLRDLGSRNGTLVNGRLVRGSAPLVFGARIAIGSTVLTFSPRYDTTLPDLTGSVVATRYTLEELLRNSDHAALYVASDRRLPHRVAIKLLSPELLRFAEYRVQFQRQAEMAAQLRHPHVCRVLDFGDADVKTTEGRLVRTRFLTFEFMPGGSLVKRLDAETPVDLERAVQWIEVVADALAHAHRKGVVHGNLKPSAIVFDDEERPYVTDFSVARRAASEEMRVVAGTPAFMAPEQWAGDVVSPATDQFALAALAYFLVTGSRPFEGQENPEVRRRNFARGAYPADQEAAANGRTIRREVSAVLQRALSAEPSARYPSIEEFARAFAAGMRQTGAAKQDPRVFLSYQRSSGAGWATLIARELAAKHKVTVFFDAERQDAAGRFPARLAKEIAECDVFVCLLGPSTLESTWVKEEIRIAHTQQRPMVPIFQEGYDPEAARATREESIEALISYDGVHLLDRRNIHFDHSLSDLARLIKGTVSRS